MKLLILGLVLVLAIVGTMLALVSLSYIEDSSNDVKIEGNLKFFKEEVCVEDGLETVCTETLYIQNGNENKVPLMTGRTIKEKVFVPKYVEREKIVYKEKKLLGEERPSPVDRIQDSDVNVFSNSVRIDIKNAKWRSFIDSNSMDPLIDKGTTTIEIKPKYASDINIGDIIAYEVDGYDYAFVHRVVDIGKDENGVYFTTKGDNFYKEDPNKVRFKDVEGIVVGILY